MFCFYDDIEFFLIQVFEFMGLYKNFVIMFLVYLLVLLGSVRMGMNISKSNLAKLSENPISLIMLSLLTGVQNISIVLLAFFFCPWEWMYMGVLVGACCSLGISIYLASQTDVNMPFWYCDVPKVDWSCIVSRFKAKMV